jgi:hypothetical protein
MIRSRSPTVDSWCDQKVVLLRTGHLKGSLPGCVLDGLPGLGSGFRFVDGVDVGTHRLGGQCC